MGGKKEKHEETTRELGIVRVGCVHSRGKVLFPRRRERSDRVNHPYRFSSRGKGVDNVENDPLTHESIH